MGRSLFFYFMVHLLNYSVFTSTKDSPNQDPFLSSWVERFLPIFGNLPLLEWSFPGAHQALSGDLEREIPKDFDDIGSTMSEYIHKYESFLDIYDAKNFIYNQVTAQKLNIKNLLDSGIRFIDFRNTYTSKQGDELNESWYGLNFLLTKQKALDYLREIKQWLDTHRREIIIIWISKEGTDTNNYKVDPLIQQKYWNSIESLFSELIYDSAKHGLLNGTSMSDLVSQNARAIFYTSEHLNFSGGSTKAMDASLIELKILANVSDIPKSLYSFRELFGNCSRYIDEGKRRNKFLLVSAASQQSSVISELVAYIYFFHGSSDVEKEIRKCASTYRIPRLSKWCPTTLDEQSRLFNYYFQTALEGSTNDTRNRLPNAVFINSIDYNGTMDIGEDKVSNEPIRYGYVYTFLFIAASNLCRNNTNAVCKDTIKTLELKRAQYPFKVWDDPLFGHHLFWPNLTDIGDRSSNPKKPYDRGIGRASNMCPPNHELVDGFCYHDCPRGFKSKNIGCYRSCPYGYLDKGLSCSKPSPISRGTSFFDKGSCEYKLKRACEMTGNVWYPKCGDQFSPFGCCSCRINCPPGFSDKGDSCLKETITRKNGTRFGCSKYEEEVGGFCYEPCPDGYKTMRSLCWPRCEDWENDCSLDGIKSEVVNLYVETLEEEVLRLMKRNVLELTNFARNAFGYGE